MTTFHSHHIPSRVPTSFVQRIFYGGNTYRLYDARLRAMEFVNQHRVG